MTGSIAFVLLWILVFTIPWEKAVILPGFGTLTRAVGGLTLLAAATHVVRRREARPPNAVLIAASLFILWSGVTWFWSLDPAATAARVLTYVQLLLLAWIVWEICRDHRSTRQLIAAYTAGAAVASLATILRYAQGTQTYWKRYAAPGFDPNDLGITVALAIPMALYLALTSSGAGAWLHRATVALICTAILLTASRTSLIAASLAFTFLFWTWRRSDWPQRLAGLGLIVLLAAGAFALAPAESRQRIATTTQEITRGTLHKRTQIWKAGLRSLKQYPIRGAGAGAYPDAVYPWLGIPGVPGHEYVAHNTFLSVLVETGAAGMLLYASFLLLLAACIWALPSPERPLWAVVMLVWVIGVSTLTWEHRKPGWLIPALILTHWARSFTNEERA